jgi:hypothetical protein
VANFLEEGFMRVHSFSRTGRRALGGLLLVAALAGGCADGDAGGDEAAPLGALDATGQAAEVAPPRIAALTVTAQAELSSRTPSLVQATLSSPQSGQQAITVDGDDGKQATLRDDGTGGDRTAGDGVFSGPVVVDLAGEQTFNRAVADAADRWGQELQDPVFDGRELVSTRPLTALPDELFRPQAAVPLRPVGISFAIDPARSLIIRHPSVVNDPTRTYDPCTNTGNPAGVWTFNHLMTEMANQPLTGVAPAVFTRNWLRSWEVPQGINGWTVPARLAIQPKIITPWPLLAGQLDMNRSPFKLVAIVNRLDLGRGSAPSGYGGSGGGELRFVFAAVDKQGGGCSIGRFLVIFEYEVPKRRCAEVKAWAQQWANLSLIALGSAAFNPALQALTQQVVLRNTMPAKPNGNAINQIRTNEIMLAAPWELREFRFLPTSTPLLGETTMALTPGDPRNGTAAFANYINTNTAAILAGTYTVPPTWLGPPFLGAHSFIPVPATTFWNAPGIANLNARHKFSLNTCGACHARETNTGFTHINEFGGLSAFLSGPLTVADPVNGVLRTFNEMLMRQNHLSSVASQSCLLRAMDAPAALTH